MNETSTTASAIRPPARQTELPSRFRHCVTAYFGEPVFDREGRRLLYAAFDTLEEGAVVLRDLETQEERIIATTPLIDFHANAQRWICGDRGVLFAVSADGRRVPAIVWLDEPGRTQVLDGLANHTIRRISADGRRGYGSGPTEAAGRRAVRRIDFETGCAETLLTVEQVLDAFPEACPERDLDWHFSHAVPNAAETLLFVKFQRPAPWVHDARNFPEWGTFLVLDLRDGALRSFGRRISGHPFWMPDDRHILNVKNPLDGSDNRHLVLVDAYTGADRRLVDLPIEGPGHPSVSPRGDLFVTDAFPPDGLTSPIYVGELNGGCVREIARLPHRLEAETGGYDPTRITRGQPHPVWSACGRRLVVNGNHDGRYMGLILLDDFLVEAH